MYRYVALIYDQENPLQVHAAASLTGRLNESRHGWHEALSNPGLRVYCADIQPGHMEPHTFAGSSGVLLGAAFETPSSPLDETARAEILFNDVTTRAVRMSRGEWLIRSAWGNYVAIWRDPLLGGTCILKDPTGSLPAFITTFKGMAVVFSAIADCLELGISSFSVNTRALRLRVSGRDMMQKCEALNEVTQIRRGECVVIDPRATPNILSRRFYWNPIQISSSAATIDDLEFAAQALRNTLTSCTRTLVRCHQSVLLRLSGGLDSSVVLGCLIEMPKRPMLLSYTQFASGSGADPRPWARAAAEFARCEHAELEVAPTRVDLKRMLAVTPSTEPFSPLMHLVIAAREQRLAELRGATAILTGDGGDSAFGGFCISEAVPAHLRRHGLSPRVFRLATQSAEALQQSTWEALIAGLRAWRSGTPTQTLESKGREAMQLVSEEALRDSCANAQRHPWFGELDPIPWEPISKVGMLLGTPDLYDMAASPAMQFPQIVSPIYAQPVMELVLRTPADVLFADGRSRGLARRAFDGRVAPQVLSRLWKDRPGDFHDRLIHLHRTWLREILLEGILVRERLLNRSALEHTLSPKATKSRVHAAEVFHHLDTEVWLRHWEGFS